MRHDSPPARRLIALVLPILLGLAVNAGAQPTPTPTPNPVFVCAGKITGASGLRDYTNGYLLAVGACAVNRLKPGGCDSGPLENLIANLDAELIDIAPTPPGPPEGVVAECDLGALDALCPLESDTLSEISGALVGGVPTSVKSQLQSLVDDIFITPQGDSCPRPTGVVSNNARDCAEEIVDVIASREMVEALEECLSSCERPRLNQTGLEVCVDDITGDPIKDSVVECKADVFDDLELLDTACDVAAVEELGCPLGAESVTGLKNALEERISSFAQQLNLGIFHSPCQGNLPGAPTEPIPAEVTLEPSMTQKQVTCGQTLDAAFFGSDKTVSFDTDLDCSPAKTPAPGSTTIDGVIVAKSGVTLNGRSKTRTIRGPSRSSLRTGTGIRLASGVARVKIGNFKAIENFGVGIEDAAEGNNKKLLIVKTTVRRNVQAGLRLRSQRVKIETVTADKNGIGMDLSGDGTKVKASEAKGSLYEPKVGIKLSGIDKNANGSVVQISGPLNFIELNQGVGIWITEGAHVLNENQVRSNVGAGIVVEALSTGSLLDTNNVKLNGVGIVVDGSGTLIDSNTCEENLGDGFVVGGTGNTLRNNSSGKKTDRGNGGDGYVITGQSVWLEDNGAEANLGSGFVVTGTSTLFKGNTSEANHEHGFDIQSGNHIFDTCSAEDNNRSHPEANVPPDAPFHEWVLAPGSSSSNSNSAGGESIGIPSAGGVCDDADDCPL